LRRKSTTLKIFSRILFLFSVNECPKQRKTSIGYLNGFIILLRDEKENFSLYNNEEYLSKKTEVISNRMFASEYPAAFQDPLKLVYIKSAPIDF